MELWRKIILILTIECEHASQLTSEALERPLRWYERAALKAHKFVCRSCRRFDAQLRFLRDAFRESGKREVQSLDEGPKLDPQIKDRLRRLSK